MPVTITFRTAGAWGAGIGMNLTPAQVDTNFYNLKLAVEDLQDNPTPAETIANVTVNGTQFSMVTSEAVTWGPFDIPVGGFSDADLAWAITYTTEIAYTIQSDDNRKHFFPTDASGCVVSVPSNTDVALIVGTKLMFTQYEAGDVLFVEGGTDVVIRVPFGKEPQTAGQYCTVWIEKISTDEWIIGPRGDLADSDPTVTA
jgi:hypothetical protein